MFMRFLLAALVDITKKNPTCHFERSEKSLNKKPAPVISNPQFDPVISTSKARRNPPIVAPSLSLLDFFLFRAIQPIWLFMRFLLTSFVEMTDVKPFVEMTGVKPFVEMTGVKQLVDRTGQKL